MGKGWCCGRIGVGRHTRTQRYQGPPQHACVRGTRRRVHRLCALWGLCCSFTPTSVSISRVQCSIVPWSAFLSRRNTDEHTPCPRVMPSTRVNTCRLKQRLPEGCPMPRRSLGPSPYATRHQHRPRLPHHCVGVALFAFLSADGGGGADQSYVAHVPVSRRGPGHGHGPFCPTFNQQALADRECG